MQSNKAAPWSARTVTISADAHEAICRDSALLAALREIVPPAMIEAAEKRLAAPRCHYGTVGCKDKSDMPHECGRQRDDAFEVLREFMQINPTLSMREALIREGADVCPWCAHALTPSGMHLHESCGPKAARGEVRRHA